MLRRILASAALLGLSQAAATPPPGWPDAVAEIRIRSSADRSEQPALQWSPAGDEARPLLVGLHTWSGDYRQAANGAVYARWCMDQGWHFVYPDFRGPNRTPEALGSDLAVQDIVDAVAHVQRTRRVDAQRIYLIGVSGGGHMAMLMAGRHPEIWAGVSAWCGIADVAQWHAEHSAGGTPDNYGRHIEAALGGPPDNAARRAEARHRSPLTWLPRAKDVALDLCHGIHDGRTGSVPFRHSLLAYTAVSGAPLAAADIARYYDTQQRPAAWTEPAADALYGDAKPVRFRHQQGQTRVTLFEGGHEILYAPALNWLALQRRGQPAQWTIDKPFPVRAADTKSGL